MGAHKVVGVDIDDTLIQAAWRRRRVVWSLQAPDAIRSDPVQESDGDSRFGMQESSTTSSGANYFPASCEHTFGHLPIPSSRDRHTEFPHNVLFRTADWLDNSILEDADGYDVVVAYVYFFGLSPDFLSSFLVQKVLCDQMGSFKWRRWRPEKVFPESILRLAPRGHIHTRTSAMGNVL